jgi:hypothetical protein|tara:strand:- start:434 stop:763 length:330 start_codon:yes stop_codon:yes gene_type:complete
LSKFATGKWAYGISDRSGFQYRLRDMRKEWNGLLVGKDEWEAKHPQLEPIRVPSDPQAIKNARPEPNLYDERQIQWGWDPVGFNYQPGLSPADNLVATGSVGTVVVVTT